MTLINNYLDFVQNIRIIRLILNFQIHFYILIYCVFAKNIYLNILGFFCTFLVTYLYLYSSLAFSCFFQPREQQCQLFSAHIWHIYHPDIVGVDHLCYLPHYCASNQQTQAIFLVSFSFSGTQRMLWHANCLKELNCLKYCQNTPVTECFTLPPASCQETGSFSTVFVEVFKGTDK